MTTPSPVAEKRGLERWEEGGGLRPCLDSHKSTRTLRLQKISCIVVPHGRREKGRAAMN